MQKTKRSRRPQKPDVLPFVILVLVIGSFALACIDEDARATFADLAKVGVGGYIGLMMPSNRTGKPD
ncbi:MULTISPECIES: hypothetical protein [Trichocoleus]|uniref:Uncharacterized protein n=1 Tax=Trichocoleus desertorum GB2-A4 TaxID=2933944 RepID=A0ABV0JFH9_9CYAN|nr:hypothetical protein [Trichocoleus sp. FACHB-46]MBD1863028.1 hypothetical protein [Trichocoleus sp. FACHB-46]